MNELVKDCPNCKHPMMYCAGKVQPKRGSGDYRFADWYCANCHNVIWTKGDDK